MTFKDLLELTGYDIKLLNARYGIPVRNCYYWINGQKKPPAYVLTLIYDIYLLERGIINNAQEKDGLAGGMAKGCKGIQNLSEARKSENG